MIRFVYILGFITLFVAGGFAQADSSKPPEKRKSADSTEETIKRLERQYAVAVRKEDCKRLNQLLAEEYTVLNEKGEMTPTIKSWILEDCNPSKSMKYISFDVSGLEISINEDVATVRGSFRSEWHLTRTGVRGVTEGKYLRTWKLRKNVWRIFVYQPVQETRVTQQREPLIEPLITAGIEPVITRVIAAKQETLVTVILGTPVTRSSIRVLIYGRDLGGSGAAVYINGKNVSRSILLQNHSIIQLEDSQKALNLSSNAENQVEVFVNGKRANVYSFSQRF